MNCRERVRRAITMTGPDRAPIHHYIFPGAFYRHGDALLRIAQRYPDDFGNAYINANLPLPEDQADVMEVIEWRDAFGVLWNRLKGYTSGDVKEPAIPTWDLWQDYHFPSTPEPAYFVEMKQQFVDHPELPRMFGVGSLFQTMQHIRGPANLLMDLAEDLPEVHELADGLVDYHMRRVRGALGAGAEIINYGDDWGAQDRLLVHPNMWRRFFKPLYKRMFDEIKDAGAFVWFHTDGWILEIIPDLIELGVNVLNPQHPIMGDERVAALAAGKLCIRTDIDRQWLIPFGEPEAIREYVKKALRLFGSYNGGIILHGEVGPDVPLANVQALYSAFYDYGAYPLALG
jgi:uroporphyrinogen decarboxylase